MDGNPEIYFPSHTFLKKYVKNLRCLILAKKYNFSLKATSSPLICSYLTYEGAFRRCLLNATICTFLNAGSERRGQADACCASTFAVKESASGVILLGVQRSIRETGSSELVSEITRPNLCFVNGK